jgi:hypothetical protein
VSTTLNSGGGRRWTVFVGIVAVVGVGRRLFALLQTRHSRNSKKLRTAILTTMRRISFCPGQPPWASSLRLWRRRRGDLASASVRPSASADRSRSSSDSRMGDIRRACRRPANASFRAIAEKCQSLTNAVVAGKVYAVHIVRDKKQKDETDYCQSLQTFIM